VKAIPVRYIPWMVRDLLAAQGAVLLAIGAMAWLIMSRVTPAPAAGSGPNIVQMALQQIALPFLLFCAAAIVSNDRVHGYYRSFFSRPLTPSGYYFTRWVLGGVVFLLIVPVLTLGLSLAFGGFPIAWNVVKQLALNYLLLGGLIFFLSTVVRADWLLGLLILILQATLHAVRRGGVDLPTIWDSVLKILPPFNLAAITSPVPTGAALAHVVLYGAGFVTAGVLVLHLRPLGSGGRS
jgi:hypothetical protein